MEINRTLCYFLGLLLQVVCLHSTSPKKIVFSNTYAVHIEGGPAEADRIAQEHGFINLGKVSTSAFISRIGRLLSIHIDVDTAFGTWQEWQ